MASALDAYPLSQHFRDRSLREEKHVRASGNVPDEYTNKHVRAGRGVTGKMNVNGDLQVKNLGNMRAGQTAYDTGIGWFFGYDDDTPVFSIGDSSPGANKMTWDGVDLTIVGGITASVGEIGGWSIGTSQLTGGDATLDSSGFLELGTSDDIVKLSSVDPDYRLWVGDANPGDAPFSVEKNGNFFAGDAAGETNYVEWDGSQLTVRGRIEFGDGDFLQDDIIHFELEDDSVTNIIEMQGPNNPFSTQGSYFAGFAPSTELELVWFTDFQNSSGTDFRVGVAHDISFAGTDTATLLLQSWYGNDSNIAQIQLSADNDNDETEIDLLAQTIQLDASGSDARIRLLGNDSSGVGATLELDDIGGSGFGPHPDLWGEIPVEIVGVGIKFLKLYE